MKGKAAWLGMAVMLVVVGIALTGCATGPSSSPSGRQFPGRSAQGSRVQNPHGARRPPVAYVQTLPAKKVVSNKYQGQTCYLVCTDPGSKQCYIGDEAAYRRYQQMAIQQSISRRPAQSLGAAL